MMTLIRIPESKHPHSKAPQKNEQIYRKNPWITGIILYCNKWSGRDTKTYNIIRIFIHCNNVDGQTWIRHIKTSWRSSLTIIKWSDRSQCSIMKSLQRFQYRRTKWKKHRNCQVYLRHQCQWGQLVHPCMSGTGIVSGNAVPRSRCSTWTLPRTPRSDRGLPHAICPEHV